MTAIHPIPPLYDAFSSVLILGSFPSVKSREEGFFYGHKQNRFWKVTAAICGTGVPETVDEKKCLLLENRIALWDVIASCKIEGSSDASIRDVRVNDLSEILALANIRQIYTNGSKAHDLYERYMRKTVGMDAIPLPSTSPANARYSLEGLIDAWKQVLILEKRS